MKFNPQKVLYFFILLSIFSCSKDSEDPNTPQVVNETATLLTHNFINEDHNVDWYNGTLKLIDDQFYAASQNKEIEWLQDENDLTIVAKNTTDDALLISQEVTFSNGKNYLGLLYGSLNKTLLISENNNTIPQTGNVRVQYANLYESVGPIDIYVGGIMPSNKKISSLDYGELSDYIEVSKTSIDARFIITTAGVAPYPGPLLGTNLYNVIDSDIYEINEIYIGIISSETYDTSSPITLYITKQ